MTGESEMQLLYAVILGIYDLIYGCTCIISSWALEECFGALPLSSLWSHCFSLPSGLQVIL